MLAAYTARYPEERAAMEPFVRYVGSFDAPALYDRKNFVGHLTAGALIVSRQTGCVLLLKPQATRQVASPGRPCGSLGRFGARRRFPGGARGDGNRSGPVGCCSRRPTPCRPFRPMRTGTTFRPARARERTSIGISTCASFSWFDGDPRVVIDRAESDGFRWVTLDELASMPDFRRIAPKIRAALSERGIAF